MEKEDLFELILLHKTSEFIDAIEMIENVNCLNKRKANLLQKAVAEKEFEIAKVLIAKGININNQDKEGQTVMHYLPSYLDIDLAKLLIEKGADLNIKDKHGNNPLWAATYYLNQEELIKMYLDAGADIYSKNKYGKSVYDEALVDENLMEILNKTVL